MNHDVSTEREDEADLDQQEIERAIKLIEGVMRVQGITKKILDERLGKSPGYFAQVLSGRLELKYRHILSILRGLELEPRAFFQSLYPDPAEPPASARMLERLFAELQRGGYLAAPATPYPPPLQVLNEEELDRRIQSAVVAALAQHHEQEEDEAPVPISIHSRQRKL